ncbi:uncharacterized protein LOC111715955 isoform X2 [Eurytemora carolleeae]|nr:uncharacterized protein LOC111715955 isoform X2 [Eurytemora carolleeae]|eukprot:XP_023347133.1 uncharacterized protein LOC111715955 isoform X2 [Eurytemora affinis]
MNCSSSQRILYSKRISSRKFSKIVLCGDACICTEYTCCVCMERSPSEILSERMGLFAQELEELGDVKLISLEILQLEEEMNSSRGRKAEKLYEIIRNLGIDRTSFLPGVMLGNQLMTFFEEIVPFLKDLVKSEELANWTLLVKTLYLVFKRLISDKVAKEEEIDKFEKECWVVGELFTKLFPHKVISVKLDTLVFVCPPSLRFWQVLF